MYLRMPADAREGDPAAGNKYDTFVLLITHHDVPLLLKQ
jgi:hypothetical protein